MTSLSRQLKLISEQAPQSKSRPSLVLTPAQAQDADRHTIFAIGQNGLQELMRLDASFEFYETNLFSESLIEGDVALMTPQDKQKLDQLIRQFLVSLSPHFLHHAAFKALEWLVRRYRIQDYNIQDLIECILPFHETPQFVHVVKILSFKEKTKYAFIQASKKTNVPLERSTLVQRCIQDLSLVQLMCKMFVGTVQSKLYNKHICAFFLCTMTEYLSTQQKPNEDALRLIYAALLKSVHATLPVDFALTVVMLMGQLSNWMVFETIFDDLQTLLMELIHSETVKMVAYCLLQIYQTQPNLSLKPDLVLVLMQEKQLMEWISKYESTAFVKAMLMCCATHSEQEVEFAQYLLAWLPILKDVDLIESILLALLQHADYSKQVRQVLNVFLQRFSDQVNRILDNLIGSKRISAEKVTQAFMNTVYAPINGEMTVYTALIHPEPQVRVMGATRLLGILSRIKKKDSKLSECVCKGLGDENGLVVETLLQSKHLCKVVDSVALETSLLQVLNRHSKTEIQVFCFDHLIQLLPESQQRQKILETMLMAFDMTHVEVVSFLMDKMKEISEFSEWIKTLKKLPKDREKAYALVTTTLSKQTALLPMVKALLSYPKSQVFAVHVLSKTDEWTAEMCLELLSSFKDCPRAIASTDVLDEMWNGHRQDALWHVLTQQMTVKSLDTTLKGPYFEFCCFHQHFPGGVDMMSQFLIQGFQGDALIEFLLNYLYGQHPYLINCTLNLLKLLFAARKADYQMCLPALLTCLMRSEVEDRRKVMACLSAMPLNERHVVLKQKGVDLLSTNALANLLSCKTEMIANPNAIQEWLRDKKEWIKFILQHIQISQHPIPLLKLIRHANEEPIKFNMLLPMFETNELDLLLELILCLQPPVHDQKAVLQVLKRLFASPLPIQTQLCAQITMEFIHSFTGKRAAELFQLFLNVLSESTDTNVCQSLKQAMKYFNELDKFLCENLLALTEEAPERHKKAKTVSKPDSQLPRLTLLLEIMSASPMKEYARVLTCLQLVVKSCYLKQESLSSFDSTLEYMIQLVMSIQSDILKACREAQLAVVHEKMIDVDAIVQCIRMTQNAQSRNLMLMTLSELAHLHPQQVLMHILPIFTFMGASVLRQDDQFTFYVIQQTMESILPVLTQEQGNFNLIKSLDNVAFIVKLFVDAVNHVPKHRRLRLFTLLVDTLGTQHLPLLLLHLLMKSVQFSELNHGTDQGFIHFVQSICEHVEARTLMQAVVPMLKFLQEPMDETYFTTEDQFQQFKQETFAFLKWLLSSSPQETELVQPIVAHLLTFAEGMTLLSVTTDLMSSEAFVELMHHLMQKQHLRKKSLSLMYARLNAQEVVLETCMPDFLSIFSECDAEEQDLLYLIFAKLTSFFGQKQPEKYAQLLSLMDNTLTVPMLTLIAALTKVLGPRMLPCLPTLLPKLFAFSDAQALAAVIQVFVDVLPLFMSPYLDQMLHLLTPELSLMLAQKMQVRVLLPKIIKLYSKMTDADKLKHTSALLQLIVLMVQEMPKMDLVQHVKMLNQFLLTVLDDISNDLEEACLSAYVAFAMKLNDALFKPCFMKVLEWMKRHQSQPSKMRLFFKLMHLFLSKLKTLFSPYQSYFMEVVMNGLQSEEELCLSIVHKVFLYAEHFPVDKAMLIMNQLMDHVKEEKSLTWMQQYLLPAVVQCLVTVRDEKLWKHANGLICQLTKSPQAHIKLFCLSALHEIYQRIGEEFLVFLPETIPFLAELMEDEQVEKECHQVLVDIEQVLGEDIQQYFQA